MYELVKVFQIQYFVISCSSFSIKVEKVMGVVREDERISGENQPYTVKHTFNSLPKGILSSPFSL